MKDKMLGLIAEIDRCLEASIKNYEHLNGEAARNCAIAGRDKVKELEAALADSSTTEQPLTEDEVERIVHLHHNVSNGVFLWAAMTADLNAAVLRGSGQAGVAPRTCWYGNNSTCPYNEAAGAAPVIATLEAAGAASGSGRADERTPTLTYDGMYNCARCGNRQAKLCEHWQDLFEMAHIAILASGAESSTNGCGSQRAAQRRETMSERKPKFKVGQLMRVKSNGALVRLILPENPKEEQVLIDAQGYVYVEPVEKTDDWYHIDQLEKP